MKNNTHEDFEFVINKYRNSLYKVAATFESDTDLIQDLHQDILFAIWKALPAFKSKSSVHTYIYRVAYNQAINHVTKNSKVSKHENNSDDLDFIAHSNASEPDHYTSLQIEGEKLISIIRQLPLMKRQLITLSLEGFSYKEIAKVTGLNVNNIAVQLTRTKQQLKNIIENDYAK
jgi:RNA polymerase sigma factor (sigma-70 family)